MPNWTTPVLPTDNIVTKNFWHTHVRDNLTAINDIIGQPDGGHRTLADGAVLLGNGEGAIANITAIITKGALLAGDGATNPRGLAVGNDDDLLRGESTAAPGLTWETINWNVAEVLMYG